MQGCDIPDIDVVVQWKLPATLSNFVQCAGRVARGRNRHGLVVLIVERSAYSLDLGNVRLTGLIGWWFWGIAHVWYLIGFRSRVVVSFEWLWSYLTFQRGARLITGREPSSPCVRCHIASCQWRCRAS